MSSKVKCECKECGATLFKFPSQMKDRKYGFFCDKDCLGLFRSRVLTGTLAANFKEGSSKEREYVNALVPWHPNGVDNYVYLHRLIMEAKLGRYLTEDEIVHHIDENPENNHWDNLEVMTQSEHAKEHLKNGTIARNPITNRYEKGKKHG